MAVGDSCIEQAEEKAAGSEQSRGALLCFTVQAKARLAVRVCLQALQLCGDQKAFEIRDKSTLLTHLIKNGEE